MDRPEIRRRKKNQGGLLPFVFSLKNWAFTQKEIGWPGADIEVKLYNPICILLRLRGLLDFSNGKVE